MKVAVFVQYAVIMRLLQGIPLRQVKRITITMREHQLCSNISLPVASIIGVAGNNAFLYMRHAEGVHKVTPALVLLVAFSSRAAVEKAKLQ